MRHKISNPLPSLSYTVAETKLWSMEMKQAEVTYTGSHLPTSHLPESSPVLIRAQSAFTRHCTSTPDLELSTPEYNSYSITFSPVTALMNTP